MLAVHNLTGASHTVTCAGYDALVRDSAQGRSAYYIVKRPALGLRPLPARRHALPMSIGLEDVERAAQRLAGVAHRTPVVTSRTLDERTGARVHVKAECFQRGGAFKFRGAFNKISSLDEDALRRGVLAYSSGNHAQAVAIAAALLGSRATIVMPEDAPAAKLDATRGYGADVVPYDRWTESREEIGARLAEERGLALVRPYDDPLVMAGQGTVALELLADAPGARPAARAGQRRRPPRRLRDRGEGAAARRSASSESSRRRATTPAAPSPRASACASTSRRRSPTGCRRPSPAS